uniref:Pappalysin 2 n=1 Tax=Astyanax mexicanus TaxID=7994 RepID=A0A8B9H2T2_ASTMX
MLLRLLAVVLVIFHTWLLNSAKSDPVQRYKRGLAQRADRSQAALGQEQCGSMSRRRLARSAAQHHQLAALTGRYSRLSELHYRIARSSCSGGCNLDGMHDGPSWESQKGLQKRPYKSDHKADGWMMGAWRSRLKRKRNKSPDSADPNSSTTKSYTVSRGLSRVWNGKTLNSRVHRLSQLREARGVGVDSFPSAKRVPRSPAEIHSDSKVHPGDPELVNDVRSSEGGSDYSGEQEDQAGQGAAERWGAAVQDLPLKWMTALYFSGQKEQLRVNPVAGVELPRSRFTLELWVKLEGGQNNPAIIAGVFDNCSHAHNERGWSVGVRTLKPGGRKDARFFFTLRTDRALKSTTLVGHQHYQPSVWTHVVAWYDGHRMALFIDGSKVAESRQQSGDIYSPFIKSCRMLLLGGDQSSTGHGFRGYLGGVVLWNHAHPQDLLSKLFKSFTKHSFEHEPPLLVLWADFSEVEQQWMPYKSRHHPTVVALPAPEQALVSPFLPPPCGVTICDNPDVILSYSQHWQLRASKRLRYRVVNVCADDGSRPTVSQQQIQQQHQALEEAFRPYNLTLELSVLNVRNSSLQGRFILSNCHVAKVGNRHCDRECDHPLTGHDGGDCLRLGTCYNWMRGDGVCNPECNGIHYDYDDGDCCDPQITDVARTCFDPESPERAYLSVKELKELLHLSSSDTLNVFFTNNSAWEDLAGAATWPWAKEALTHQGGMILNPSYFGTVGHNTMIHEMGHIFGLYHVFKGVSERESCDDPCRETTASMETGDLCADTEPSPKSKVCRDPDPVNDTCGLTQYHNTPYTNYMSYTGTNSYTASLLLSDFYITERPLSVSLSLCGECPEVHICFYVFLCVCSGAPDVYQVCEPSMRTWSPEFSLYEANMTSPCPQTEGCVLQLYFQHPVIPDTITIWITYISTSESYSQAISNLEFILETGESLHAGPQQVFCDVPLTLRVNTNKKVKAIKMCTFDKKLEIDAALLTSRPQNPLCSRCRPLLYRVLREPAIREDWSPVILKQNTYTDRCVTMLIAILHQASSLLSHLSPANEECDDGNLLDGDGCSKKCRIEPGFNCAGRPSRCYIFEGDGVCEEFERGSSVRDCGFFTPEGFIDQWASSATASHQDQHCSALAATGMPDLSQVLYTCTPPCNPAWVPYSAHLNPHPHHEHGHCVCFLKVEFERPGIAASVLIYLAYDGGMHGENCRKTVHIQLCDTNGLNHTLGTYELSCQRNPLVVNVTHNLSLPFYQTAAVLLNFSTVHVAVLGVALRTSCHFSAFALTGCAEGGLSHLVNRNTVKMKVTINCRRYIVLNISNPHRYTYAVDLVCESGVWDRMITCQPVDCGVPNESHVYFSSFSCPWGTTFGKQCTFTCRAPAILQGKYSITFSTIKLLTELLSNEVEILLIPELGRNMVLFVCVCVCVCVCIRRILRLECMEGGRWQQGGCTPVSCPSLPAVFEGMYSCTNRRDFNSVCTLHCPNPTERNNNMIYQLSISNLSEIYQKYIKYLLVIFVIY